MCHQGVPCPPPPQTALLLGYLMLQREWLSNVSIRNTGLSQSRVGTTQRVCSSRPETENLPRDVDCDPGITLRTTDQESLPSTLRSQSSECILEPVIPTGCGLYLPRPAVLCVLPCSSQLRLGEGTMVMTSSLNPFPVGNELGSTLGFESKHWSLKNNFRHVSNHCP